jgi:hypothetical protein
MFLDCMTSSTARKLIECLVTEPDPFGVNKYLAAQIPTWIVTEAWTPARREEIRKRASGLGYTEVDSIIIGDYDLVLWHSNNAVEEKLPSAYFVSINNAQHDPIDFETQQKKQIRAQDRLPVIEIRRKLIEWLSRYDKVIVGSVMRRRNAKYSRMVRHLLPEYRIEPFYGNSFDYGFLLSKP